MGIFFWECCYCVNVFIIGEFSILPIYAKPNGKVLNKKSMVLLQKKLLCALTFRTRFFSFVVFRSGTHALFCSWKRACVTQYLFNEVNYEIFDMVGQENPLLISLITICFERETDRQTNIQRQAEP